MQHGALSDTIQKHTKWHNKKTQMQYNHSGDAPHIVKSGIYTPTSDAILWQTGWVAQAERRESLGIQIPGFWSHSGGFEGVDSRILDSF